METDRVRFGTDTGAEQGEQGRAGWEMKIKSERAGELSVSYAALSKWRVMHTWQGLKLEDAPQGGAPSSAFRGDRGLPTPSHWQ